MLVALIGMYVLAGEPLEPLVEALHPEPETANMREIEKQIYGVEGTRTSGMFDHLRRAATLMRGGKMHTGRGPAELTEREHDMAWRINDLKEREGLNHDEIFKKLRLSLKLRGFGRDDVDRLAKLNPKRPDAETVIKQYLDETRPG